MRPARQRKTQAPGATNGRASATGPHTAFVPHPPGRIGTVNAGSIPTLVRAPPAGADHAVLGSVVRAFRSCPTRRGGSPLAVDGQRGAGRLRERPSRTRFRPMRLLLIRHAETTSDRAFAQIGQLSGGPDPALTNIGLRQADLLATAFVNGRLPRPDVLMSSLLRRAVQTVAPLADALNMPVVGSAALREVRIRHHSAHAPTNPEPAHLGLPTSTLGAICPRLRLPAEAQESGWCDGRDETPEQAWRRAQVFVATLPDPTAERVVAVVTHGWFVQYLMRAVVGWAPATLGRCAGGSSSPTRRPPCWGDRASAPTRGAASGGPGASTICPTIS